MVIPVCECTECVGAENLPESVEMATASEEEEESAPTERHIAYESLKLRSQFKKEDIIHAFKQIVYERSIQVMKQFTY